MDRLERLGDLGEAVIVALAGWQAGIWSAMPAIIQSVDPTRMTVTAQPVIQAQIRRVSGTVEWVTMPLLVDVPLVFPSGGGFILTFPVAAGDEALVVFSARCIDSWWQSGGIQVQAELRMHDLSDGFAIVGPRSLPRVVDFNTTGVELRNDAGTVKIEMVGTEVHITAPGGVTITGNLDVTGSITAGVGTADQVGLQTHLHDGGPPPDPGT